MFAHLAASELIYFRYQSVQELTVVTHDDGRTVEGLDGFLQHVLRRHIQMVRRLVENQQVHGLQQQADHRQATTLTTAQHLHLLVRRFAAKHKGTQYVVDFQAHLAFSHIVYRLEHGQRLVQQLCLVLGKIAYLYVMPYLQVAVERNLAHDALHQCRLSLAVLTHKGHLLAAFDGQVHMVEHQMIVFLSDLVADNRIVATAQTRRELQVHGGIVHLIHLDGYNLLQLFHLLLYLHGLRGLIAETLDEILHLGYLLLLVLVGTQLLFASFLTQHHIFVVLHLVVRNLTARNLHRPIRYIINKSTVVTYQHNGFCRIGQILFQPLYRLNVQMVRRLIKQQHIGLPQQNFRQLYTHAPTAREFPCLSVQIAAFESQSRQRSLYLGLIAVSPHHLVAVMLLGKPFDQRHILLTIVVRALGQLLVHAFYALCHLLDVGKGLLGLFAHRHRVLQVHHLRQVADGCIVRHTHHTGCRLLLPAKYFEQSRFSRTVLAHQGNTVAIVDYETGVRKQRLHTKLHTQSFYRNHYTLFYSSLQRYE